MIDLLLRALIWEPLERFAWRSVMRLLMWLESVLSMR